MALTGKLEKMLILAFDTAEDAESGGTSEAKDTLRGADQPRDLHAGVQGQDGRRAGTGHERCAGQVRVHAARGADVRVPVRQHRPDRRQAEAGRRLRRRQTRSASCSPSTRATRTSPTTSSSCGGTSIFKGRAIEVGITYKLFNPDGQPIRAVVTREVQGLDRGEEAGALEDRHSPDLTHRRTVRARRHAALAVLQVYGDPRHYLFVADSTGSTTSGASTVGQVLSFPPLRPRAARR